MGFGHLFSALLSCFCDLSEEQRPAQQQPRPEHKPFLPVTEQPPRRPQPGYNTFLSVAEQLPRRPQPGYNTFLPVAEQPPSRPAQRPPRPARPSPPVERLDIACTSEGNLPRPRQNAAEQKHDNEHYQDLRTRAKNEGAEMMRCFDESHTVYARMDGALAKKLSNEGKAHQREMERLNAQASEWIFNGACAAAHRTRIY